MIRRAACAPNWICRSTAPGAARSPRMRAQIAELLQSEIESMPGRVRRLLRARPSTEIRANSALDADEVAETEALVEFVGACRYFAGELALNEMTQRTFAELQQYLDSGTRALLDGWRHAGEADRSFRQSQVDGGRGVSAPRYSAPDYGRAGQSGGSGRGTGTHAS